MRIGTKFETEWVWEEQIHLVSHHIVTNHCHFKKWDQSQAFGLNKCIEIFFSFAVALSVQAQNVRNCEEMGLVGLLCTQTMSHSDKFPNLGKIRRKTRNKQVGWSLRIEAFPFLSSCSYLDSLIKLKMCLSSQSCSCQNICIKQHALTSLSYVVKFSQKNVSL